MNVTRIILILIFYLSTQYVFGDNIAKNNIIEKDNVYLNQLICDQQYKLNCRLTIINDFQDKYIINNKHLYEFYEKEKIEGVCVQAFVKWCNKFVQEKRDYVVFRVSWRPIDSEFNEIWPETLDTNTFKKDGSEVLFDPFYNYIDLSKYLLNNKILTTVSIAYSDLSTIVKIHAIIPYKDNYYMCSTWYYFNEKIDTEIFKKKDIINTEKFLGELIAKNPHTLIMGDGATNQQFFMQYFKLKFDYTDGFDIQRIDIHPESEQITLNTLFELFKGY